MAYEDLLNDVSESFEDGNYFIVTISDLDVNRTYPLQFRWAYKDGTFGKDWSPRRYINTPGEDSPNTPGFNDDDVDVSQPEKLIIRYRGVSDEGTTINPEEIDRVDIYINGSPFDGSKPTDSFKEAGTKIIPAPAGTYIITLYAVSKLGVKSPVSSPVTKTVTASTIPVGPPTLPSGLSVAAAPFAVSVNWNGTYSTANFNGFKSIDVHVRGSDVGSSATSGFSTTTQVATLTVNSTTNRQNVGLDNLRQALSLANNQAAYTSPMFFYYIAKNSKDELYSVNGVPTYTRINSTSVNPTQANFVDLANGVISIENLVAGNGQFSSWMRVGSAGGTRIELSGTNDFINSGNTVQKGLVAYSSGSTEIFNLDIDAGTLVINGSGTFTGDLTAGSGSSIFKSDSNGIYLGNSVYASAPFSVSRSGVIKAQSGTIGGWTLGSTFLQGNNLKLDNSQIVVGATSSSYLDISPSSITHRNANGTASGIFTLTLGSSAQLSMSGTISLNSSSTIAGTAASTVTSGAASGANAVQPGNGVSVNSTTKVINEILMNNGGISISTASSGTRMQLNNSGLQLFNGNTRTVFLDGASGSAEFTGTINASTVNGSTITGGLFTTGSTGARIQITGSDQGTNPNSIVFYNPGGSPTSHIVPMNIGGTQYGLLMHYGSTADASGGSYPQFYLGSINATMSSRQFSGGPSALVSVDYQLGVTLQTNSTDININGPAKFSSTMFAPNLATTADAANMRVATGSIGQIFESSSSSLRFKENVVNISAIQDIDPNKLLELPVRAFSYKEGYLHSEDNRVGMMLPGFIAEEVEDHYPIAVDYSEGQPQSWNERFIVPGLLSLIQNLNQELINIKSRLDALEG